MRVRNSWSGLRRSGLRNVAAAPAAHDMEARAGASIDDPFREEEACAEQGEPGPDVTGTAKRIGQRGDTVASVGGRVPFGVPHFREREGVDALGVARKHANTGGFAREELNGSVADVEGQGSAGVCDYLNGFVVGLLRERRGYSACALSADVDVAENVRRDIAEDVREQKRRG